MVGSAGFVALLYAAALTLLQLRAVDAGFPAVTPTQGEPWPAPQQADMYDAYYWIDPSQISFKITHSTCADLKDALVRYDDILKAMSESRRSSRTKSSASLGVYFKTGQPPFLQEVEVYLDANCTGNPLPSADMQEQYLIKVNTSDAEGRAQIVSNSLWGMYRGLETFTHLIYFSEKHNQFHLRQGMVRDYPRYAYRSLLLDTSRHFLSVDTLKATLDLMTFNKLNVFHWHIVDDPSFPFVSQTFPELSEHGAFSQRMVYGADEVADVIEYARKRGIRVIPELDTPGHVRSWGQGRPELLTICYNSTGLPDGTTGPLDPSKESTYDFIQQLVFEVTTRFPDKYVHLGGDEVSFGFSCWLSNPNVQAWMLQMNVSTPTEIENVYIQRLLQLVADLPTKPGYIIWQEVVDNSIVVQADAIVQVWKDGWEEELAMVTGLGHRTILSTPWYLNVISYGIDWPTFYEIEPESFDGTVAQKKLVVGGEACMWGEYVDDTNVVPRTWPRAAAVAERLWSSKLVNSTEEARGRMEEHRCRLLSRGYPVEPANGPGFC